MNAAAPPLSAHTARTLQLHPGAPVSTPSLETFQQLIAAEFIAGSAIDPTLFKAAVDSVRDTAILPGSEIAYPIHDALNWHVARFGRQALPTFYAALLQNEDRSTWQAKLSTPRIDTKGKEGKVRKYETPKGNGARAYLPPVPTVIRQRISERYNLIFPSESSFWDFVEQHPELPIVVTEGGKKSLAGLSQGFITVALYGCHGGYTTKDKLGHYHPPTLIPNLARFAVPGRPVILAFDEDASAKTRHRVAGAQWRLSQLLTTHGCTVAIAQWDNTQGKGLDDLIVNASVGAWEKAYADALPFSQWKIWQGLERRLTWPASLTVTTADLATPDPLQLPNEGIVAVQSPKGTGKTKLLAALVARHARVLALSHRISLGRNLCARTGLTYRGDLDKVQGKYINPSGYTLRIGSCVDGLLSLDPAQFVGCTLILDEVVALVRHLLTSATCARDGKRPALLARFRALVRAAKLVLLADADLDNATLQYIQELRGDEAPLFLVRNNFEPQAYPCTFLQAPDPTAITSDLLAAVAVLPAGQVLYVATDSKARSKSLQRLITQQYPDKRVLLLNSETTGGECEREFMQTPDAVLERGDYDVILCSPSVSSGVSIECQGRIDKVYGVFTGVSATDADMSQALSRVREPVERRIWCATVGSNYSPVSRSGNRYEVRKHLLAKTTATMQLLRSSLREDVAQGVAAFDWQTDPHLKLYCSLEAERNRSMYALREALLIRLRFEGHTVTVVARERDQALKHLLAKTRADLQRLEAEALVAAPHLHYLDVQALALKETRTPEEQDAIAAFHLRDFYDLETLTVDVVLNDKGGRQRQAMLALEGFLYPETASDRSARTIEKQVAWHQGLALWDISHEPLRSDIRRGIGLDQFLEAARTGALLTRETYKPYADRARALVPAIKVALRFTIKETMSDVQIIHQLLSQMGIRMQRTSSRQLPGHEGQMQRCYRLDSEAWSQAEALLARRQAKRERLAALATAQTETIHPPDQDELKVGGGSSATPDTWLLPEQLADVRSLLAAAGKDPEVLANLQQAIPPYVLAYLAQAA